MNRGGIWEGKGREEGWGREEWKGWRWRDGRMVVMEKYVSSAGDTAVGWKDGGRVVRGKWGGGSGG